MNDEKFFSIVVIVGSAVAAFIDLRVGVALLTATVMADYFNKYGGVLRRKGVFK